MQHAGNQIALGDKLYFFTSPIVGTTNCLIWGHGGLLFGDGRYALPGGTTIHYYVPHGQNRTTKPSIAIGPSSAGALPGYHVTGPADIENYRLRKAVGSGWSGEAFSYHDVAAMMSENQDYMRVVGGNWCPHVVSVRRRFKMIGKTIQLGEIIDAVQHHDANIVGFYYGACRADHTRGVGGAVKSALIRGVIEVYW
jgi:hypothetical protein